MKNAILILFLAITTCLNAQDFEGSLTYAVSFEISDEMFGIETDKDAVIEKMKSQGTWSDSIQTFYKSGFYKQINLPNKSYWTIYNPKSNNIYGFNSDEETADICTLIDASRDLEFELTGKKHTITLLDTLVKFKNYNLQVVEIKWATGTYYYYFDKNYFQTNPENFKNHLYDGFYEYLKIAKVLPVMLVKDVGGMMIITTTLVSYSEQKVKKSIFEVPELLEDEEMNSIDLRLCKALKISR